MTTWPPWLTNLLNISFQTALHTRVFHIMYYKTNWPITTVPFPETDKVKVLVGNCNRREFTDEEYWLPVSTTTLCTLVFAVACLCCLCTMQSWAQLRHFGNNGHKQPLAIQEHCLLVYLYLPTFSFVYSRVYLVTASKCKLYTWTKGKRL